MDYKEIKELSSLRGTGTSLVTLYLQNTDSNSTSIALSKLNYELGTASNIKSKDVRKNVTEALKTTIYNLKSSPYNKEGLVFCSGIVDGYCV